MSLLPVITFTGMNPTGYPSVSKAHLQKNSLPYVFHIRTSEIQSGYAEYAIGRGLVVKNAIFIKFMIHIPFSTKEPFYCPIPIIIDPKGGEFEQQLVFKLTRSEDLDRITKVFVTVVAPCLLPLSISPLGIGKFCNRVFPHMKYENSTFSFHCLKKRRSSFVPEYLDPQLTVWHETKNHAKNRTAAKQTSLALPFREC